MQILANLLLNRVVRREHVGDQRAAVPQADRRVGIYPFRPQPLHLGAPFVETLRGNKALSAALAAITAAVVGVILNLAVWFAIHTMFHEVSPLRVFGVGFDAPVLASINIWAAALSVAAVVAVFRFKAGMLATLAACSLVGVVLDLAGAI